MINLRRAADRGRTDIGWLDSWHTFSFGEYRDLEHMGFRSLRVINDDRVAPGKGFGEHGHRDMEILTYVLEGELRHSDSLRPGSGGVIRPGDVQVMSAGTGIRHSEFNASDTRPVHLLQTWMLPERTGLPPRYEQKHFPRDERRGRWRLIGSRDGREGAVTIMQDVDLYATVLGDGQSVEHGVEEGMHAWLHLALGRARLGEASLSEGDGAAVRGPETLTLTAEGEAEALLFVMP